MAVLRSYSQILFSDRPVSGLCFLAASFATDPFVGLAGLTAALSANLLAAALRRDRVRCELGLAGYNAVLVGLTLGLFLPAGPLPLLLALLFGLFSVLLFEVLHRLLSFVSLPVLGLPFLGLAWLVIAAAGRFQPLVPSSFNLLPIPIGGLSQSFLHKFGSVFFSGGAVSGTLVLVGLLFASRVSFLVALVAGLASTLLAQFRPVSLLVSLNLIVAPVGLAFFLAPDRRMPVAIFAGFLLTLLTGLALEPVLGFLRLPLLILPLTLVLFACLLLGRSRVLGLELVPVRLLKDPETHLRAYRARTKPRLNLPFFGTWSVSQGIHGGVTHVGALGHAWDFMVRDDQGRSFVSPGYALQDYFSFGLLVSAPGPGRVVGVENEVPDNPPGRINKEQNWGNWVIIEHSPLDYSILAHLKKGSVRVSVGDQVAAGEVIGGCGNSGYSAQPHLHYQLQETPVPGAWSRPAEFQDYLVACAGNLRFVRRGLPQQGETVQPLAAQSNIRRLLLGFVEASPTLCTNAERDKRSETWHSSRRRVRGRHSRAICLKSGSTLVSIQEEPAVMLVTSIRGSRSTLLAQTFEGLGFIPCFSRPGLQWGDVGHTSGGSWHHQLNQEPIIGLDSLLIASTGPGVVRRIWLVEGLGVARVDWERKGRHLVATNPAVARQ